MNRTTKEVSAATGIKAHSLRNAVSAGFMDGMSSFLSRAYVWTATNKEIKKEIDAYHEKHKVGRPVNDKPKKK